MKKILHPQSSLVLLAALLALVLPAGRLPAQDNTDAKTRLMADAIRANQKGDLAQARKDYMSLLALDPNNQDVQQQLDAVNAKIAASPTVAAKVAADDAKAADAAAAAKAKQAAAAAKAEQARINAVIAAAESQSKAAAAQVAADGNVDTAAVTLDAAAQTLTGIPAAQGLAADIQKQKAELPLAKAQYQMAQGDAAGARATLDAYAATNPDSAAAAPIAKSVLHAELHPPIPPFEKTSGDYLAEQKKIALLLATGRSQFNGGNLSGAEGSFKEVVSIDPHNSEAIYFLGRVTDQLDQVAEQAREENTRQMIREVDEAYAPPAVVSSAQKSTGPITGPSPLLKKLDGIMLPEVSFNNLEIDKVVQALGQMSVQYDTSGDTAKGVNIILNEENPKQTVKIDLRNLSLHRILDLITEKVGYQYEVQQDVVVLSTGGGGGGGNPNLNTEYFPVTKATVSRITGATGVSSSASTDSGTDPFAATAASTTATPAATPSAAPSSSGDAAAIQGFFQNAGVDFSGVKGSAMAYDGSTIIVTQTAKNIDKIRNILARYNDIKQVSIETKFIEVEEDKLNEVGVNWNVARTNGLDTIGTLSASGGANNNRNLADVVNNAGPSQSGSVIIPGTAATPGTAAIPPQAATVVGGVVVSPAGAAVAATPGIPAVPATTIPTTLVAPILPEQANTGAGTVSLANISKLIGTFEVNAVVNALNQTSGSELLSSPTVTVLSGNPANITVAQELRYPQSYGDPRSTASNGGAVSLTPGTPQEFTTRNIGVELKVTPTVEDDDYSISLDLNPRVTEFDGFIEYGGQSVAIAPGNTTGGIISTLTSVTEGGGGQPTVVTVPSGFFQPVFSTREVVTKVTIWDGATLVMGGLTREEVTKVNDSVPILGDIPLIGNLFKSKGESVQKRNLLIFVTANLVSPGGSLKKQDLKNVARDSMFQAPSVTTPGGNDSRVRNTATGK